MTVSTTGEPSELDIVENTEEENVFDDSLLQLTESNRRLKNKFISHCLSFLQEDHTLRQTIQINWNSYLRGVGEASSLSAFFDRLPLKVKSGILPKYRAEISAWFQNTFRIECETLLPSTHDTESNLAVIGYVEKLSQHRNQQTSVKSVIYVADDIDKQLESDILRSFPNISLQKCQEEAVPTDLISIDQLEAHIDHDSKESDITPLMVIAQAGSHQTGFCDDLIKIREICEKYNIWLHVNGDFLGCLATLPNFKDKVKLNCHSATIDLSKLIGIQNLPYLTVITDSITDVKFSSTLNPRQSYSDSALKHTHVFLTDNSLSSDPFFNCILNRPSITVFSVWSLAQRCSKQELLAHMQYCFQLTNVLMKNVRQVKEIVVINENNLTSKENYHQLSSNSVPDNPLPKLLVIFRFEPADIIGKHTSTDMIAYIDLLNQWLFDKMFDHYPKMNLELIQINHLVNSKERNSENTSRKCYAIRFAPFEHLVDAIDQTYVHSFSKSLQYYCDIMLETMESRKILATKVKSYENFTVIPTHDWAGVGAIRYTPSTEESKKKGTSSSVKTYDTNTVQIEISRKLRIKDFAFSLGSNTNDKDSELYILLGMTKKRDDLDVLLRKIYEIGQETEASLKNIQEMAEKVVEGIEKAEHDLKEETNHLLTQEGLLRQLPLVSNIMSWWSPSPTSSPLAIKGRSFDLDSGQIQSTENIYLNHIQSKSNQDMQPPKDFENHLNKATSNIP